MVITLEIPDELATFPASYGQSGTRIPRSDWLWNCTASIGSQQARIGGYSAIEPFVPAVP